MIKADVGKRLVVIGAGGHAREVVSLARQVGFDVVGCLDDFCKEDNRLTVPILGRVKSCYNYADSAFVVAVGSPRLREQLVREIESIIDAPEYATLVHPSAIFFESSIVGPGSVVAAGVTISVNVEIGRHALININASVSHDAKLGNFATVAPNAALAGGVELKDLAEVGLGAGVKQGGKVMRGGVLGMGGVLLGDLPENCVYVGNPASYLKKLEE